MVVTSFRVALAVAALLGIGVAASIPLPANRSVTEGGDPGPGLAVAGPSCLDHASGAIAIVGRIKVGRQLSELAKYGQVAEEFVGGDPAEFVVFPSGGLDQSVVSELEQDPAVQQVGLLRGQSEDPALRSCHRQLADAPAAVALMKRGIAAVVENHLVSQAQLNAAATSYMLTDDPLNSNNVFLAVVLAKPNMASVYASLSPIVAVVDRTTLAVNWVGPANWYVGQ